MTLYLLPLLVNVKLFYVKLFYGADQFAPGDDATHFISAAVHVPSQ